MILHDQEVGSILFGSEAYQTRLDEFAEFSIQLLLLHHEIPTIQEDLSIYLVDG